LDGTKKTDYIWEMPGLELSCIIGSQILLEELGGRINAANISNFKDYL